MHREADRKVLGMKASERRRMQVYAIGGRCGRRFEPRLGRRIVSFGHLTKLARKSAYSPYGHRVESPGRQIEGVGVPHSQQFGYRVDFPVAKPLRTEPQAGCRIWRTNRMRKRRHSCFIDPRRAVFPSDADLRRRRFPPQRRYARMIPQRRHAGNASGRSAADAGGPPSARPPCARGRTRRARACGPFLTIGERKGRPSTLDKLDTGGLRAVDHSVEQGLSDDTKEVSKKARTIRC